MPRLDELGANVSQPMPLPLGSYTQRGHFDLVDKDPINLAYVGDLGDLERVRRITDKELGLWADKGVGDQLFLEPHSPHVGHRQDFNLADSPWSGVAGRTHTRIYQAFTKHDPFGTVIASPIHEESWAICKPFLSDSVRERGFDAARDWAIGKLVSLDYEVLLMPMVRYGPVEQCNRKSVATDGKCAVVAGQGFFRSVGYAPTYSKADGTVPRW